MPILHVRPEEWAIAKRIRASEPDRKKISRKDPMLWFRHTCDYFMERYPPDTTSPNFTAKEYQGWLNDIVVSFLNGRDDSGEYFTPPDRAGPYEFWQDDEHPLHSFDVIQGTLYANAVHHYLGHGADASVKIVESEEGNVLAKRICLLEVDMNSGPHPLYKDTHVKEQAIADTLDRFYDCHHECQPADPDIVDEDKLMPAPPGMIVAYEKMKERAYHTYFPDGTLHTFITGINASALRHNHAVHLALAIKLLDCVYEDAHRIQIQHGDITPDNVMLSWAGGRPARLSEIPLHLDRLHLRLIDFTHAMVHVPALEVPELDRYCIANTLMVILPQQHWEVLVNKDEEKLRMPLPEVRDYLEAQLKTMASPCHLPPMRHSYARPMHSQ